MSRMATNEYIGAKRRAYAQANRAKRKRILDEVCETTGYERKYANRLLTGNRKFRERKGRGKAYGDDVAEVLKKEVPRAQGQGEDLRRRCRRSAEEGLARGRVPVPAVLQGGGGTLAGRIHDAGREH